MLSDAHLSLSLSILSLWSSFVIPGLCYFVECVQRVCLCINIYQLLRDDAPLALAAAEDRYSFFAARQGGRITV